VGISHPSGYAAAAGGFPLVICVIAEQVLFGRGVCVGGVSPVSVCGLYLYVRYIEASLPLARYPLPARALLCRAVGISHVVSSREWARGLHYRPQPTGLVGRRDPHIYFLFRVKHVAHSESTQRECFCGVCTRSVCCTLFQRPSHFISNSHTYR